MAEPAHDLGLVDAQLHGQQHEVALVRVPVGGEAELERALLVVREGRQLARGRQLGRDGGELAGGEAGRGGRVGEPLRAGPEPVC